MALKRIPLRRGCPALGHHIPRAERRAYGDTAYLDSYLPFESNHHGHAVTTSERINEHYTIP